MGWEMQGEWHERTEKAAGKKKKRGLSVNSAQQSRSGNLTLAINFFFSFGHTVRHVALVPRSGIELQPPALEGQSLNHWTMNF